MTDKEQLEMMQQKYHDLQKEYKDYQNKTDVALAQLSMSTDQLIIELAMKYGEKVYDEDVEPPKKSELIGWRLECDKPGLKPYKVKAENRDGKYIIGVVKPMEKKDDTIVVTPKKCSVSENKYDVEEVLSEPIVMPHPFSDEKIAIPSAFAKEKKDD